jgi:succinate dehydrogenase/fumarate reductase flavoprotein subunit
MTDSTRTLALSADHVPTWTHEADVVIVGHGGAGASAAIEAARAGADVLVVERLTRGGGTTANSTGVIYFGGGTRVQLACGFDDTVEEMIKHVRLAGGRQVDEEKVRLYCERSVEHFDWMCDLGVPFSDAFVEEKTTHPFGEESLFYSGNELVHPFVDQAVPAPRGHKPAQPGEVGGFLAEFLLAGTHEAGARVLNECRVQRLVQDRDRRVGGVVADLDGTTVHVRAHRGVILAAGGFIMNKEMVAEHAPDLLAGNWETATATDDGLGIRIGAGAGGALVNMHEGLIINAIYPPGSHCKGVLVNGQGQRFINEDAYSGRFSDAMLTRAQGRAFLILDDEIHGETQAFHQVAAVEATIADLERALDMPEGELVHTVEAYNRFAAQGEDPLFHKAPEYLRPLGSGPYGALDCTIEGSIYAVMTLGGLHTKVTGEVVDVDGALIPGLYAAGRVAAGLPLEGRTYASGLSIGDATFFGRVAGRHAAGRSI